MHHEEYLSLSRVQFITHYTAQYTYVDSARLALQGGCRWIQLRMKDVTCEERRTAALRIQEMCRHYNAVFIIDDDVTLVREVNADGVHLGLRDMPIHEARRLLGADKLIGGTANRFEDIEKHYSEGADYIGCGPFRFTTTKQNLSPVLGTEGYLSIVRQMREKDITLPIVAIGGITTTDIPSIMQTGVTGIALSGSILRADNPVEEMQTVMRLVIDEANKINRES